MAMGRTRFIKTHRFCHPIVRILANKIHPQVQERRVRQCKLLNSDLYPLAMMFPAIIQTLINQSRTGQAGQLGEVGEKSSNAQTRCAIAALLMWMRGQRSSWSLSHRSL